MIGGRVRVGGTEVACHVTVVLVPVVLGAAGAWRSGAPGAAHGLATAALLQLSAVHMELGRRLTLGLASVPTREVLLTPLGGAFRLERGLERAASRLAFAFGSVPGPLSLLAAAACLLAAIPAPPAPFGGHHLAELFWWNLGLAASHALPAIPFGLGRLLAAPSLSRTDGAVTVMASAAAGRVLGIALALCGAWVHPYVAIAGLVAFVLAGLEAGIHTRGAARITGRFGQSY